MKTLSVWQITVLMSYLFNMVVTKVCRSCWCWIDGSWIFTSDCSYRKLLWCFSQKRQWNLKCNSQICSENLDTYLINKKKCSSLSISYSYSPSSVHQSSQSPLLGTSLSSLEAVTITAAAVICCMCKIIFYDVSVKYVNVRGHNSALY